MSLLLQARAWGRSPGHGASKESGEAVTEAEGSEALTIYSRRTAGILTSCFCCHDNWLPAPEKPHEQPRDDLFSSELRLRSHFLLCCFIEGQTLWEKCIFLFSESNVWMLFRIYKCCFVSQSGAKTSKGHLKHASHLASWPPVCTPAWWPLQMSSFKTTAGAAAADRWRFRRPIADRHWCFSRRHFNTTRPTEGELSSAPVVKDQY